VAWNAVGPARGDRAPTFRGTTEGDNVCRAGAAGRKNGNGDGPATSGGEQENGAVVRRFCRGLRRLAGGKQAYGKTYTGAPAPG